MNKAPLPQLVIEAFPILKDATYYRDFVPLVPIYPDTTFGLFVRESGEMLILITTDYADPQIESMDLKECSGHYKFEFKNLVKPYGNDEVIEILDHDDMDGNFFVSEGNVRYYVARVKQGMADLH